MPSDKLRSIQTKEVQWTQFVQKYHICLNLITHIWYSLIYLSLQFQASCIFQAIRAFRYLPISTGIRSSIHNENCIHGGSQKQNKWSLQYYQIWYAKLKEEIMQVVVDRWLITYKHYWILDILIEMFTLFFVRQWEGLSQDTPK